MWNEDKDPFIVRFLLVLALFPISILVSQLYYAYQTIFYNHWFESVIIKDIEEMKWSLIESVIDENHAKARLQAEAVKQKIISDVAYHYYENPSQLTEDLITKNDNSLLIKIIKEDVINNNDHQEEGVNNRMFVATHSHILVDNENFSGSQKTWKEEISSNKYPKLAMNAVEMILTKDNHIVYWGATSVHRHNESSNIPSYAVENGVPISPESLTEDHLREEFEKKGLDSLKEYSVLVPVYISKLDEVFGSKDITERDAYDNSKDLIVVQEFNLYDVVHTHKDRLEKYDYLLRLSKQAIHNNTDTNLVALLLVIILTLTSSIGMIYGARLLINRRYSKEGE